jgi:hypothetical protein
VSREDDERRAARREQHLRRLGARHPRCADCGESDPTALVCRGGELRCYECLARRTGRTTSEAHHVFGRHNDPGTAAVPGNMHRRLSDEQRDWPPETLRNPDSAPLREIAAALRSMLDLARVVGERAAWMPEFLEQLDDVLRAAADDDADPGNGP